MLQFIRDHAEGNTLSKFKVFATENWTSDYFDALVDILRQSRPVSIYIEYDVNNQSNAVIFWQFLMSLLHACPHDTIESLNCNLYRSELNDVDWEFVNVSVVDPNIGRVKNLSIEFGELIEGATDMSYYDEAGNYVVAWKNPYIEWEDLNETNVSEFVSYFYGMLLLNAVVTR